MLTRSTSTAPGPGRRRQRALALIGAGVLLTSVTVLDVGTASASSHREAPLIAGDPRADNTDVYAFVSPDKPDTVTLIANWIPFEEPNGGPNFYPFATDARYNIKIDNDGDGKPDITYRWTFSNHDRRRATHVPLQHRAGHVARPTRTLQLLPDLHADRDVARAARQRRSLSNDAGRAVRRRRGVDAELRAAAATQAHSSQLPGGGQSFAGQADDPFFLDLRVFDLLYGGNLTEAGHDTLAATTSTPSRCRCPRRTLALSGDADAQPGDRRLEHDRPAERELSPARRRRTATSCQVSRLGNPLVNEVVVPAEVQGRVQHARAGQGPHDPAGRRAR